MAAMVVHQEDVIHEKAGPVVAAGGKGSWPGLGDVDHARPAGREVSDRPACEKGLARTWIGGAETERASRCRRVRDRAGLEGGAAADRRRTCVVNRRGLARACTDVLAGNARGRRGGGRVEGET